MHFFFHGQESLSILDWILRAAVIFIFVIFTVKIMGSRAISQLRLLDFVIALMLGNIIAHPLSDHRIGLKGSVISTIVIVVLYLLGIFLSLKWPGLRRIINSKPFPLIKDGEILYKGLKRARISIDDLLAELRKEKVEDVKKVALAIWESSGEISLFLEPQFEAITPSFYQLQTEPFDLPQTVIREGRIDFSVLRRIGKEEEWLIHTLRSSHHTEINNILLATIDRQHNLQVFLYK
ncbi:hypothetical protein BABA_09981 [Neobacillus bataviensis LMG 21833]|uniref:YetF C-terminal domain-containing protein n=1 Tax=Neobacillus bataviensis LMG 21833 TaxID=1117379 RepID=K6CE08_9BACI|nr:DUF421 domain-containing protein [Neobacillus bataviensis]EKN69380.1 hypothetical protein BABA_09981 [Neobacillus bataviensis LMG 21833]